MDPEEKELLEETVELSKENNKMLRSMYSSMRWGRAFRIFYWVLIIGLSVGAFYFIEPYVRGFQDIYNTLTGGYSLKNFVK